VEQLNQISLRKWIVTLCYLYLTVQRREVMTRALKRSFPQGGAGSDSGSGGIENPPGAGNLMVRIAEKICRFFSAR
jgi:hypothetical protein